MDQIKLALFGNYVKKERSQGIIENEYGNYIDFTPSEANWNGQIVLQKPILWGNHHIQFLEFTPGDYFIGLCNKEFDSLSFDFEEQEGEGNIVDSENLIGKYFTLTLENLTDDYGKDYP